MCSFLYVVVIHASGFENMLTDSLQSLDLHCKIPSLCPISLDIAFLNVLNILLSFLSEPIFGPIINQYSKLFIYTTSKLWKITFSFIINLFYY